jgi:putative ABC transport system permease protein
VIFAAAFPGPAFALIVQNLPKQNIVYPIVGILPFAGVSRGTSLGRVQIMMRLWQDFRFGVRMLGKHPTLSVIAILTFGLGIGLTTTVCSVVNGALFKGLPFEGADRVVALVNSNPASNIRRMSVSVHDFAVWRERQTVFQEMGAWTITPVNLAWGEDHPERFSAGTFSTGVLVILGVKPVLGRIFRAGEDAPGADPVIILGHDVWRDRFNRDPDVLGKTVRANGVNRTIIGVMPERFAFPNREQIWIPLPINPLATKRGEGPNYNLLARLRDGVTVREANAQAATIAQRLAHEYPESNRDLKSTVMPFTESALGPEIHAILYTMLGAGVGVLLIACVNVSNLLLARISLRMREVAVRIALGAARSRVVMQLLAEVLVLAIAGGALGMLFSAFAMEWFLSAIAADPPPFWITFEIDLRLMLIVTAVTFGSSILSGIIPALQATRANAVEILKDESRGSTGFRMGRFSGVLVIAEVAGSCCLLIGAALMIKSVVQLKPLTLPFQVEKIFTARINLPRTPYKDSAECIRFYEQLLPRLEQLPGVEAATLSDGLPAAGNGTIAFQVEGKSYSREADYPIAREGIVTPGYFQTFQTRLLQGRDFSVSDRPGLPAVAIVNTSFARTYFADENPLGRRFRKGRGVAANEWLTVVGVVPDMLMQGLGNNDQSPAGYYIPIAQSDVTNFVSIALRTRGEPSSMAAPVREAVVALDKDLAIYQVLTMREVIRTQSWFYTVFGTFFMAFGCIALFLAIAGLYGVMSFAVSQRTREMGIRMALGARGPQLVQLTMKRGVVQLALGLAIGFLLALLAVSPLEVILYKVDPRDPLVLITVLASLAGAGLLASYLPARRVRKINPVIALAVE